MIYWLVSWCRKKLANSLGDSHSLKTFQRSESAISAGEKLERLSSSNFERKQKCFGSPGFYWTAISPNSSPAKPSRIGWVVHRIWTLESYLYSFQTLNSKKILVHPLFCRCLISLSHDHFHLCDAQEKTSFQSWANRKTLSWMKWRANINIMYWKSEQMEW